MKRAPRSSPVRDMIVLGLVCAAVAIVLGRLSPGTYQDDDVDRYFMARQAARDPQLFLNRWGMPLPLLLFTVPARAVGYAGIEVTTALLTALTAILTALAARAAGSRIPTLAGVFLAAQPLALRLSWSALAEPVAACVLAGVLWAWYTRRPGWALVLAGLLPVARVEAGLLTLVVLAAGWSRVGWKARLLPFVPIVLWNALGFLTTKDPLFVFLLGNQRPLNSLGLFHYVRSWIVIAGPVVLFFFLWAIPARWTPSSPQARENRASSFPLFAMVLVGVHVVELSLLAWEALPVGRSIGFLRHFVVSAPAVAMTAAWGAEDWGAALPRRRLGRAVFAVLWPLGVACLLSHQLIADSFIGPRRVEWRWMVTAGLAVVGLALLFLPSRPRRWPALLAGAGAIAVAAAVVRPIGLDPERAAVLEGVNQIKGWGMSHAIVHANHPWFFFLSGRDRYDRRFTPPLTRKTVESGARGSLYFWENHYGNRLYGDVPVDDLRRDPRFRRLLELQAGSYDTFRVVVFLKEK